MNDRYAKMKAAFEKQQSNRGMAAIYEGDGHYKHPATQREWENWQDAWQAATEAAKATGTAGELTPLPTNGLPCSYQGANVTLFSADQMHEYGQACANAALAKVYAIAVEEKAKMDAEPARQPAPVMSDKQIDELWEEVLATNPLPQPAYRALVRAALAARSQP